MINKYKLINTLFVLTFPLFGIGKYLAQVLNYSVGHFIAILPSILIFLIGMADLSYRKKFKWRIKANYLLLFFFTVLCIISIYRSLLTGLPGINAINTFTLIFFVTTIINIPVILQLYNSKESFSIEHLIYLGLTIDLFINLAGYSIGLRNATHSIPGRLNLPFGQGFYATANSVAILNLIVFGKLMNGVQNVVFRSLLIGQFLLNIVLMLQFNSRLSIMIFTLSTLVLLSRSWRFQRVVFIASLITIPTLLSFSVVLYNIFSLPIFSAILKRVSFEDVTGFNGRRDLWERGLDWWFQQGQGFFFGNGYRGHYVIGLLEDLERFWFKSSVNMHLHSSLLEYSLSHGAIGVLLLLLIIYKGFAYCCKRAVQGYPDFILVSPTIYLIFLFQIDNYVYMLNYGTLILASIVSPVFVDRN